ncbi:DNRLRE domain-containing protein [Kibdelosporangium phytohabitans]|uniref:Uncharacterized protein n=1 Tax=Kibdelosporangium phytohabitans TaxID=860235 RepID=A0A0N9I0H9_9PSEU|nr:DNRLRE domain-containing protein [Kibdelosporangium phytohabitans]ALG09504.1 hypothetical protein AOZ06_23665 [Kibdelosporangium phytohabitans]MBE1469195.1 hypothetical protein [Kibdelosporangium phytohabitans]
MGARRLLLALVVAAGVVLPAQVATAAPGATITANPDGTYTLRQELTPEHLTRTPAGWTAVSSGAPTNTGWNGNGTSDGRAPAGHYDFEGPRTVLRSYFQFDVAQLRGARVLGAELSVLGVHSYSCGPTGITLSATAQVSPQTNWLSQPPVYSRQQRVEDGFCGGARWVRFPVAAEISQSAQNGWDFATFGLSATDESSRHGWRKYGTANTGQAPVLTVTFERLPQS